MTRTGKIARLPREVREKLNRRLLDGEQGKRLVAWLNELPEVQAVLDANFGGRPIAEQNLSEWKKGGFEDWRRHQESLEMAGRMLEETEDYEALSDDGALSDRLAEVAAISVARLLRETARLEEGPEKRQAVLAVVRELIQLRRADRAYERAHREDEIHERESDNYFAKKRREIDRSVQHSFARQEVKFMMARTMKADHEAKGEPVPADVVAVLAAEGEFQELRKRWAAKRADLMSTGIE